MNNRKRSTQRASTLIEVLVVIVVFLIGILAIAQVFPKGFRILDWNRRATVSTALAREEIERLKAHADELPDEIVPISLDSNGNNISDPTRSPQDLGPIGDKVDVNGNLYSGLQLLGPWQRYSGANTMRRVIGETQTISAPRNVGAAAGYYGALITLLFGPIDYNPSQGNLAVYGNDMVLHSGLPQTADRRDDSEYFITNELAVDGAGRSLLTLNLPSGESGRQFRISFSAYVQAPGGSIERREFSGLGPAVVPAGTPALGQYPLYAITAQSVLSGFDIKSIDVATIRVQRIFEQIPNTATSFTLSGETQPNPYRFKLLNDQLGVILVSPDAYNYSVLRADGKREALVARINYDVYDWRVLREDFRVTTELPSLKQLSVRSLRVAGGDAGDGTFYVPMREELSRSTPDPADPLHNVYPDTSVADAAGADNFLLMDLETGGVFYEKSKSTGLRSITVDKALGLMTVQTIDTSKPGVIADLQLPDGSRRQIRMDGRAVRALYMSKMEFSLQVLKGASIYYRADTAAGLASNSYFSDSATSGTQVFFSRSNQGRKVTVGQIYYYRSSDSNLHSLASQDFTINFPRVGAGGLGLPSIDIRDADPLATSLDYSHGYALRDVKGASVAVRVLWNPESVSLDPPPASNFDKLEQWGRGWRRTTDETIMSRSEIIR